jgi:NADH-quinone oxidoreductase subunit C
MAREQKNNNGNAGSSNSGQQPKKTLDHKALFADLNNRFGVYGVQEQRPEQSFLKVAKIDAVPLITYLKQVEGYGHLVFFTAVDKIEDNKIELLYMLHNYWTNHDLGVTVEIERTPEEQKSMDSIHHLWPAAQTYQQELREMYGVDFPGSPRLHENFALEGWDGPPPMLRDFDTKEYSEKTFYERPGRKSHDTREHMKKSLYPSEAETW